MQSVGDVTRPLSRKVVVLSSPLGGSRSFHRYDDDDELQVLFVACRLFPVCEVSGKGLGGHQLVASVGRESGVWELLVPGECTRSSTCDD